MSKNISRRNFIKGSALLSSFLFIKPSLLSKNYLLRSDGIPDLAVIEGLDPFLSTMKAVELLGGMNNFVKKGVKVGLLINSDFDIEGAYVNPDVSIATVKMCFDAGASEVRVIQNVKDEYWKRSGYYSKHKAYVDKVVNTPVNKFPPKFDEENWAKKQVPNGKYLKEIEVIKAFLDCDVFINIPISKHHASTLLTCAAKNMMGICTRETNVGMHLNGKTKNDPDWLAQCIVDLHTLRKPDLYIVDSTKFIVTNGPVGPGETVVQNKIIAGTSLATVDAYAGTLLDYEPEDILTTVYANKMGMGEIDLSKVKITEVKL